MSDTGWKAKVRESQYNFLKWGEYMKRAQIAERKVEALEKGQRAAIEYCLPHCDQMWAASVIANLLDCDFRDSKEKAGEYLYQATVRGVR